MDSTSIQQAPCCTLWLHKTDMCYSTHVQPCLAQGPTAECLHSCLLVQKVVFTDLSYEATAALSTELARQAPQYRLSLEGTPGACHKAVQLLQNSHEVSLYCHAALTGLVSLSAALGCKFLCCDVLAPRAPAPCTFLDFFFAELHCLQPSKPA